MRPISPKLKQEILLDPFYNRCCISGTKNLITKIDWHHNLKYAGKQVNEKFCILPVRYSIHFQHQGLTPEVRKRLDWIMLNRATEEELEKYSKCINLKEKRDNLNDEFGEFNINKINYINMSFGKKEPKKSKFKKCDNCKVETQTMLCHVCKHPVYKQK